MYFLILSLTVWCNYIDAINGISFSLNIKAK